MPSPVGHALGGFAAGWLVAGGHPGARPWARPLAFAAAGVLADADLLVGLHSRYTHSLGATAAVFVVAFVGLGRRSRVLALAIAAAFGSHILLDWLAEDSSVPIGIMALWPFTDRYYLSHLDVFMGINRHYWSAGAWRQDAVSVARELAILVPVAAASFWVRRGGRKGHRIARAEVAGIAPRDTRPR